jgi:SAM-dependent methyltransferase
MRSTSDHESLLEVNRKYATLRGVGGWRELYARFIDELEPDAVLELGSGDPAFLSALPERIKRVALDGNAELKPLYHQAGVDFYAFDFDCEDPPVDLTGFDIAVCSDVFEHLLYPQRSLKLLADSLTASGVLFSHVPNEFRLRRTVKIMLGHSEGLYFFPECDEWNQPHLRRYTDLGYSRFLQTAFKHNLRMADLNYTGMARLISRLRLPVPYCLQGGPTYASTNDEAKLRRLRAIKAGLL